MNKKCDMSNENRSVPMIPMWYVRSAGTLMRGFLELVDPQGSKIGIQWDPMGFDKIWSTIGGMSFNG